MKITSFTILFFCAMLLTFAAGSASAGVPRFINYEGKLTNNTGQALNGTYTFGFSLSSGTPTGIQQTGWSETQSTDVINGLYSFQLGSVNNTLADLPFDTTYYLQITVTPSAGGATETLTSTLPLSFLTSPYAFRSKYADSLWVGGTVSASSITGTLPNTVIVTTGSIYTNGGSGASNTTFLRGDGQWIAPASGTGDMTRSSDGVIIANSTTTLQNQLNNVAVSTTNINSELLSVQKSTYTVGSISLATTQILPGTLPNGVLVTTSSIYTNSGTASNSTFLRGDGTWNTPAGNVSLSGNNIFSGYNTFGQVQVASVTITGGNVVLTATAAYASAAGTAASASSVSNGVYTNANNTISGNNTFSGYNSFGQVQLSSVTITGGNVVLAATAAYASAAGSAATIANGVYTNANNTLSGYNTFGQVQLSSVTITGGNVVLTATAAYANAAGNAATAASVTNGAYANANNTFSGYNTFGQVQLSSVTITGGNVVLTATAAYASTAGTAATIANGVYTNANNTLSGYNTFGQVQLSSVTITGGNVVLTATAAYANAAGNAATAASVTNGAYANANNTFSGYNTFGQVQLSSVTITGGNVVLTATAAYASAAGSAATIANGVYTNANNTLSGYNTFGQVQLSSVTITGGNVVLTATAAYASAAGTAASASSVANGVYTNANNALSGNNTFSGYNTFGQVQLSSVTITGGNVVLTATAAYASEAGNAATAAAVTNGAYTNANNAFSGYNTFGQVQVSSITITGGDVVLTATAAYASIAGHALTVSNGVYKGNNNTLTGNNTFNGYNTFGQVQVTSVTITGANVILTATAAYASAAGSAATAASILNGVYTNTDNTLSGNNNFSGYNTFGQVQVASVTITGANVVLAATVAYASTAGSAGTAASIANGVYTNADNALGGNNTFSGYNTFGQVQVASVTITGGNVVLTATAAYASMAGSLVPGAVTDGNISSAASISGSKLAPQLVVSSITATGSFRLMGMTAVQLQGLTPVEEGQLFYCSDDRLVYVSTGTVNKNSFAQVNDAAKGP